MQKFEVSEEISVIFTSLEKNEAELADLAEFLSNDEKARAKRFIFDIHRHRYIAARGILRQLLGNYLNINPKDIQFAYNEFGKPYLSPEISPPNQLEFNLSHTENWAAYALSWVGAVGIDIEAMKTDIEFDQLAQRFFSGEETKKLAALPMEQKCDAFFNAWTRKEALLKALGQGLSFPLNQCEVSLLPTEEVQILTVEGCPQKAAHYTLAAFCPESNLKGAVVCTRPQKRFHFITLNSAVKTYYEGLLH